MADQVDVSGGARTPAGGQAAGERPHQFGLTPAMALIAGASTVLASIAMITGGLRRHMSQPAPVPPYR